MSIFSDCWAVFKRGKQTPIKKKKKKEHFFGFLLTVLSIWDTSLSVINDALNFLCHARARLRPSGQQEQVRLMMWRMKVLFRSSWWQTAGQTWVIKVWKGRASVSQSVKEFLLLEKRDWQILFQKTARCSKSNVFMWSSFAVDLWPLLIVQLIMFQWPIMLWPPRLVYKFCKQLLIVAIFQGFPSTPADRQAGSSRWK